MNSRIRGANTSEEQHLPVALGGKKKKKFRVVISAPWEPWTEHGSLTHWYKQPGNEAFSALLWCTSPVFDTFQPPPGHRLSQRARWAQQWLPARKGISSMLENQEHRGAQTKPALTKPAQLPCVPTWEAAFSTNPFPKRNQGHCNLTAQPYREDHLPSFSQQGEPGLN